MKEANFIKLNEGVVVNTAYILKIRRLTDFELSWLHGSYEKDMMDSVLKGTGLRTNDLYTSSLQGGYKLRDGVTIAKDLPELCLVVLHGGGELFVKADLCRQITGIQDI